MEAAVPVVGDRHVLSCGFQVAGACCLVDRLKGDRLGEAAVQSEAGSGAP